MEPLHTQVTVRFNPEEAEKLRDYCHQHRIGYSKLLKQLTLERINQPNIEWPTAVFAGEGVTGHWSYIQSEDKVN